MIRPPRPSSRVVEPQEYLVRGERGVINHIRSVEYNLYNLEIQQTLANVATNKDQQLLTQLEQEISDNKEKIVELKALLVTE